MNFQPIPIEDVLTVTRKDLEALASKKTFSTEKKKVDADLKIKYSFYLSNGYYHRPDNNPESDIYCASISFESHVNDPIRCKFGFYVKSADFFVKNDKEDLIFSGHVGSWSSRLFSLADILNPEKNFLADDKLTLHMKGMLFAESYMEEPRKLLLHQLLWERDDRDFVISVGKEGEPKTEIKIHKLVLVSRSPVFDRMLQTNMKEKAESKLEIIDFDVEVVRAAVDYFYEHVNYEPFIVNVLIGLLQFADKYAIQDLKADNERLLKSQLSPDNVCQIANASIISNSSRLKECCLQTMIIYLKQGIPFADVETLDRDFVTEMLKKASSPDGL